MPMQRIPPLARFGSAVGVVLVLAGCTPGGQFDPTTILDSSVFDTKKKIQGQREPLFPNGVPGAETGVPPDLMKGYQPPPDQDADKNAAPAAAAANQSPAPNPAAQAQVKPKPKPKPKLAAAPAPPQDKAFDQKQPTRINIGLAPKSAALPPGPAQQGSGSSQSVWPAPPQTAPTQQTAQPSQSIWPAPPTTAPTQQAAQPAPSIWPNPPAPGTTSQ
jgi:hypothetical protein